MSALVLAVLASTVTAAPQDAQRSALEDLGDSLIGDDLLKQLQPVEDDAAAKPQLLPDVDELRRMLDPQQQPQDGEDLGQQRRSPLESISDRMEAARKLIAAQNISGETQAVQQAIVSELDELIDQLNKQCQECQSGQSSQASQQQQQAQSSTPQPAEGQPQASSQPAPSQPAQSQVTAGGGGEAQPGDPAEADVVKKLWGQLPERLRQQLLQSSADEFLPKYRAELEAYFRRLAEEGQGAAASQ